MSDNPLHTAALERLKQSVETVESSLATVQERIDTQLAPVRKTAFARFPSLFTFLVAFGAAATFFGFERLIAEMPVLYDRPWLILAVGITVLVLTGRLYRKLS